MVAFVNTPWGYSLKLLGGRLPDILPSGYIFVFVCGIFFARLARKESVAANSRLIYTILLAGAALFASRLVFLPRLEAFDINLLNPTSMWRYWLQQVPAIDVWLVGLSMSAGCAFLVLRPHSLGAKLFTLKPIRVLAPLSYGLYLMHVPIFQGWNMMAHRFHASPTGIFSCAMSWGLTLVSAYALHRWVEVPFQQLGKRN